MKKITTILAAAMLVFMLAACGECSHSWKEATCTEPQVCEKCGIQNGEPLGHDWIQKDETTRECTRCGLTETVEPEQAAPAEEQEPAETKTETPTETEAPTETETPTETEAPTETEEPVAAETHWYDEHIEKMKAQSASLEIPEDAYFLSAPVNKTILGSRGICIYELYAPSKEAEKIGKINNGTVVSVLAQKDGYALFVTSGGLYAWGTNQFVCDGNDTPVLVSGKTDDGKKMIMSHDNKVYVLYDPYGVFTHMTTMEPNTKVTAYKTVNGFTYVETKTVKGWVNAKFLSEVDTGK